MGKRIGCVVVAIIGLVALGALIAVFLAKSGLYNVAATYPDDAVAKWFFSTTMDSSVKRRARGIRVPNLDDPAMIKAGAGHYMDDCVFCHGAPGVRQGEVARGLNPPPPRLVKTADDWKPNELFWITKNGVRMSGMPAWGTIDKDDELWETVAFVRKLPKMTPEDYQAQVAARSHE